MLPLFTSVQAWVIATAVTVVTRTRNDAGQATAEYALVLVGAAAVAVLLITWATKTDRIGKLLDSVVDSVAGRVKAK